MLLSIFLVIFISIILNVHNNPCFEDKSSSITLQEDELSSSTLFRIRLQKPSSYLLVKFFI